MTLFVTGSASFIGRALLAACDARGKAVVGVDMADSGRAGCHAADIRDPAIADLIPEGAAALVHLAALSRDTDCRDNARACFDVNVMGTLNLMEAARKRGVRQFVFASSEWVYDGFPNGVERSEDDAIDAAWHTSEYALSKLVSEANLRQKHRHGFCDVTVLRFGIVYAPRPGNWSAVEALTNAVLTRDTVEIGARDTARRFIHVDDIADSVLASLGLPGFEIVNIQGARLVTLGEVVDIAARLSGRSPQVVERDPANPSIRTVSSAKAERLMNWRAGTDIEAGIASVVHFLQSAEGAVA